MKRLAMTISIVLLPALAASAQSPMKVAELSSAPAPSLNLYAQAAPNQSAPSGAA